MLRRLERREEKRRTLLRIVAAAGIAAGAIPGLSPVCDRAGAAPAGDGTADPAMLDPAGPPARSGAPEPAGGTVPERVDALIREAEGYQAAGEYRRAASTLATASGMSGASGRDAARLAGSLGRLALLRGEPAGAIGHLERSIRLSVVANDRRTLAASENHLGLAWLSLGEPARAAPVLDRAVVHARQSGDTPLAVSAMTSAARAAVRSGDAAAAKRRLRSAADLARPLPASRETAYRWIGIGEALAELAEDGDPDPETRNATYDAYHAADGIGERLDDARVRAWALGALAGLYEGQGRDAEALTLYRQASFQAQRADAPELLYRWQWASGRVLRRSGDQDAAIDSFRRSISYLERVRQHIGRPQTLDAGGNGGFHDRVEPAYLDLADALLARAARAPTDSAAQPDLFEARDSIERLKAAELEDYFRDECVESLRGRVTRLDRLEPGTAVLYPVLLPGRTVLLVGTGDTLTQFPVAVTREELDAEAGEFRRLLEKRTTREYRPHANRLYQWIVEPVRPLLEAQKVDTLVLVPDGPLRMVPLAALHDGEGFLIERYAIANTPGLSLTDHRPLPAGRTRVLANGITESVQGYPALTHVAGELDVIEALYGATVLRDDAFRLEPVRETLTETPYSIVHIASHGEFGHEVDGSFLLTYDGRLGMDQLERYMGLGRYRERPVELLTLSACRTATGDERAALGLAGVGVKAGARSALATLWTVNDEASSVLVSEFYRRLRDPGMTKASALRSAQLGVLADRRYRHPGYWSPFLLIGNWL